MDFRTITYKLNSGKNPKFVYYLQSYLKLCVPRPLLRAWRGKRLKKAMESPDSEYMSDRVDYYNRLSSDLHMDERKWLSESVQLRHQPRLRQKVYYLDAFATARWFPRHLRWKLLPGDITHVPDVPSVLKSRPIDGDNANSVLLKLNRVRHFIYVDDRLPFAEKKDMAVFRGKVKDKDCRRLFMERFFGHPRVDAGIIDRMESEWRTPKMSISEHLQYRYVMALEGNDVASNLKWVMSSHSIAVMPKPRFETWFMEGRLIGGYHYIEVKPDFSDLIEKLDYYSSHLDEAEEIIRHANDYVSQFRDSRRESLIEMMVLDKYFRLTNKTTP
ncbi:MAG: glycosyl transferase family 90 [Prevotella sp.]